MKVNDTGLWTVFLKNLKRTEDGNMASNLNTAMNGRRKLIHVQLVYVHLSIK